jgi:hypothetical protein
MANRTDHRFLGLGKVAQGRNVKWIEFKCKGTVDTEWTMKVYIFTFRDV